MLVTHLSYAFLNPLRWLFGTPRAAGAVGDAHRVVRPGSVWPETCVAAVELPGGVAGSLHASYVAPATVEDWRVSVVGTRGPWRPSPATSPGATSSTTATVAGRSATTARPTGSPTRRRPSARRCRPAAAARALAGPTC